MIIRDKPRLLDILLAVRGTLLPRLVGRLLAITVVAVGAVVMAARDPARFHAVGAMPFTLVGLALSIFMSFRNNACYDRWWEGRKQWGALIIAARSLARQSVLLDPAPRRALLCGVCAFAGGLAARLRTRDEVAAISRGLALAGDTVDSPRSFDGWPNPTDAVLRWMGEIVSGEWRAARIVPEAWRMIEEQCIALAQVQASCERIAGTPVPFAYSLLLHRTAYVFCLSLPVALAGTMGWWTLLPCLVVGYTFFGLDALGDQLEEPFGIEPNDLPIDALVRTVERELLSVLGVADLPAPIAATRGILL